MVYWREKKTMMFLRKYLLHNTGFKSQLLTFFRWLSIGKIFCHLITTLNYLLISYEGIFQMSFSIAINPWLQSSNSFSKTIHLSAVTIPSPVACIFVPALLSLPSYPVILGWDTDEAVPLILTIASVQVCISRVRVSSPKLWLCVTLDLKFSS